ncbi:MAG: hypothetical protein F4Y63_09990 [Chloroflexi bacterium]|nr:hypothetical protein [Chloroflexota bacterium]MYF78678.1 hypothetical protein [Chloroflexota bacterium]MYK62149.1 hypothetical protein [Chloroflexota bacterium]
MKQVTLILGASMAIAALWSCGSAYITPLAATSDNSGSEARDSMPRQQQSTVGRESAESSALDTPKPASEDLYEITYLETTVEACESVAGTETDPCDPDRYKNYTGYVWHSEKDQQIGFSKGVMWHRPYPPHTTIEVVRNRLEYALIEDEQAGSYYVPHVVVRGVFLPNTSRCAVQEEALQLTDEGMTLYRWPDARGESGYVSCYMDFEAREYLFGAGPRWLTVTSSSDHLYVLDEHERYRSERYLRALAAEHDEMWEGNEAILWLGIHRWNAKVEVWQAIWTTNVQRDENGQVVVATPGPEYFSEDGPNEPYIERIHPPLDDFKRDFRLAIAEAIEDFELKPIGDANQKYLRALYASHGAHDIEDVVTVLPPEVLE